MGVVCNLLGIQSVRQVYLSIYTKRAPPPRPTPLHPAVLWE